MQLLCDEGAELAEYVRAVQALPYGRPSDRTVDGMLRERRGTCSTKHLYLARVMADRFPETSPQVMHRVYYLDRATAERLLGAEIATQVPTTGLVDVHRYLRATVDGHRIEIDATFPGTSWDGHSPMPLACGPGRDYPAGSDPDADKRGLEARHCDPAVREPLIALLERTEASSELSAVPEHLGTVTPRLVVGDGASAIDFYREAFGASEIGERYTGPGGELIHAELRIGDSVVMITQDAADGPAGSPDVPRDASAIMATYWEDVDAAWQRALDAGAEVVFPLEDQFYGERGGRLRDPFGQQWMLSKRIAPLPPAHPERPPADG